MIKVLPLTSVFALALILSACTAAQTPNQVEGPNEATNTENQTSQLEDESMSIVTEVAVATTYDSPAGTENVRFMLFVDEAGVITKAETEVLAQAPISVMRQESFQKELPSVLVGKKLSEIENIDRVGGSSLTTGAFNAALAELKAQL